MECGLSLKEFRRLSFYEMGLVSERNKFHHYRQLDYVRNIMWASGNWKRGTTPEKVMPLPTDKDRVKPNAPTKEQAERMVRDYAKYLPNRA